MLPLSQLSSQKTNQRRNTNDPRIVAAPYHSGISNVWFYYLRPVERQRGGAGMKRIMYWLFEQLIGNPFEEDDEDG